ncbi:MAG TPA: D-alanyl-D-alanine carboxypeptidase/D-alanyl-D-alanine-endopeptidase [Candidatus Polarisedimenticolia bacterium]|nr:D-alanyl-D-alanine carboxypeptidase/D-alanyl-D-alanine-endopeptidase [Candidatus Polarisedimenticolia bacterium]
MKRESPPSPAARMPLAAVIASFLLLPAIWIPADRTPPPLPSGRPDTALATRLDRALAARAFDPRSTGVEVLSLRTGERIFSHNARVPLRPASTMKILTGAAALALLQPEFVFETDILAPGPIDAGGTVAGDLYVRGSGAPDLVAEAWWLMARELARLGLRRVTGDLIGDDSFFDDDPRPAGWPPRSIDSWYNAPVSALSCNFNVITVRAVPGGFPGARPGVDLDPASSFFRITNRARTADRRSDLTVDRLYEDGRNILAIDGDIRLGGGPQVFRRAVEDPTLFALHTFRDIALREGIIIEGALRRGRVPEGAQVLHSHRSRPLGVLVRDMNKNSNNFMAEALLKTLGARIAGTPGTTDKGLAALESYLRDLGVPTTTARLSDGSGLSERNRLHAELLAETLARVHRDFSVGPELVGSLSIGGIDGTLDARFRNGVDRRQVRAKTGRLAGVAALAGYAVNRDGHPFAFAVLANDVRGSDGSAERAIDRLVSELIDSHDDDLRSITAASAPR